MRTLIKSIIIPISILLCGGMVFAQAPVPGTIPKEGKEVRKDHKVPVTEKILSASYTATGSINWSIDGVGSNNTPVGTITAIVPAGSTILMARLYTSTWDLSTAPIVVFNGTNYPSGSWTYLGSTAFGYLHAYRIDVTSQMQAAIGSGSASPFTFTVNSETPNNKTDGVALVIVYANAAEANRQIVIYDGALATTGETFTVNFPESICDPTYAGFEALLSLGIGFSATEFGQYSLVNINGTRLSSSAGGYNDGTNQDGALFTIGGIGDSKTTPPDPYSTTSSDDELYNLASFLSAGDNSFTVNTVNPSNDDIIFFLGLNTTTDALPQFTSVPSNVSYNTAPGLCSYTISGTALDPTAVDDCGPVTLTNDFNSSSTLNGAVFPEGTTWVTWTATDNANQSVTHTFSVEVVDNQNPVVNCLPSYNLTFNGESSITLNAWDLVSSATDNCGIASLVASPSSISCTQLGTTVTVSVTATDVNGRTASCSLPVYVGGLPCYWSISPVGCGTNATYTAGIWTLTGTDCYYIAPFNSDELAFVKRTMAGNGSITAMVTNIPGTTNGWAGIVMRESSAQGSKKVQMLTNLHDFSRREVRYVTNGSAYPQQFPYQNRYWLRIMRQGQQFVGYVSPNGVNWFQVMAATVNMSYNIEVGLIVTNYEQISMVTATFSNVNVTNGILPLAAPVVEVDEMIADAPEFLVFPNPTSGELTIMLDRDIDEPATLILKDITGRKIWQQLWDKSGGREMQVNIGKAAPTEGVYLLSLQTSKGIRTKEVVLTRQ